MIYTYLQKQKNVFTGERNIEPILCEIVKEVSSVSVKIKILALNKITTVRKRNIMDYPSSQKHFTDYKVLQYKD